MSQVNPYGGPRVVGYIIFAVCAITLIVALANTSFGEWGTWNYFFGAVVLLFGIAFLYSAVTDRMNIVGRNVSGKANFIISILGLIATVIVVISTVMVDSSGGWTLNDILTTGVFAALAIMFLAAIPVSRAKMQAGD